MAQVEMEEIVDHLSTEMRHALEDAVREVLPGAQVDGHTLFRAFKKGVRRWCNYWEQVPDQHVRADS